MANKPKTSIIVLNYKTKDLTLDCIKSILKFTKDLNYEIILVDNNSGDGSLEAFKDFKNTTKTNIKIIESKKNTGFTGGNNLGLAQSEGEFILFLNSDTVLFENSIKQSTEYLENNPETGAMSCKLQNLDGSLQGCGGFFPNLLRAIAWMLFLDDLPLIRSLIKPYHLNPVCFRENRYQDWIAGTFFLTRRSLLEKIGSWDEDYFMYVEDVDLCFRIKQNGWKIFFWAETGIKHLGSASSSSDRSILSELKNIKLFYKKHKSKLEQLLLTVFLKAGCLLRLLIFRKGVYAKALTTI